MTSVILSGGMKMRDEHGMLREVYIFVMTSVILSGGMKMRVEHGMLREVYIFCHDFCHTFRSSMECLGRYIFIHLHCVSSLSLHLPLHLQPSGKHFHLPPHLQPSDSCYATPSAPRNRTTKTHKKLNELILDAL